MMKGFLAVFLVVAIASTSSNANLAQDVVQCGDTTLPAEVYVEGCEETPCNVKNGDAVKFEMVYYPR